MKKTAGNEFPLESFCPEHRLVAAALIKALDKGQKLSNDFAVITLQSNEIAKAMLDDDDYEDEEGDEGDDESFSFESMTPEELEEFAKDLSMTPEERIERRSERLRQSFTGMLNEFREQSTSVRSVLVALQSGNTAPAHDYIQTVIAYGGKYFTLLSYEETETPALLAALESPPS